MAEGKEEGKEEEKKKGKKKGSLLKWIIFILVPLILLGGGGFFAYIKFFHSPAESEKKEVKKEKTGEEKLGYIYPLSTFVVNLSGGKRYLKASISLELDSEKGGEEMEKRLPRIRDNILMLLSNESFENISTPLGKDNLKKKITDKLNAFFRHGKIKNIYFTEFIVQ